jgi:hypothetical protein
MQKYAPQRSHPRIEATTQAEPAKFIEIRLFRDNIPGS